MLRLGISSSIIVGTVQCRVSVTEKHNIFVSFKSWNHGILQEALHYHQPQYVQNTYIKIHPSSIIAGVSFILSVSSKFPQQHRAVIAYICRLRFAGFHVFFKQGFKHPPSIRGGVLEATPPSIRGGVLEPPPPLLRGGGLANFH